MPEFAVARVQGLVEGVAEVVSRNDAEGAYRGERATLGAAEGVLTVAEANVLPVEAARQADAVDEHVSRLHAFPFLRDAESSDATRHSMVQMTSTQGRKGASIVQHRTP